MHSHLCRYWSVFDSVNIFFIFSKTVSKYFTNYDKVIWIHAQQETRKRFFRQGHCIIRVDCPSGSHNLTEV